MDIIVNIVPRNIIQSMAEGDMLAIIFSVMFGLGIAAIGERGKPVLAFFQGTADAMFWVTNLIMKFAPFGVFAFYRCNGFKIWVRVINSTGKITYSRLCNHDVFRCSCSRRYCEDLWHKPLSSYQSIKG